MTLLPAPLIGGGIASGPQQTTRTITELRESRGSRRSEKATVKRILQWPLPFTTVTLTPPAKRVRIRP